MPPLTDTVRATAEPTRAAPADSYSARHLSVLEGLEAVRKRPGMYIGSTDGRGLQHCLWEIIDNAVDEALGGFGTRVEVILHGDGSAEVRDNGRGIPVDTERKTRLSGVELVMTRLHAGGKFGGGSYTASGGLHGVGASVVNALSARLDIEVDREGHTHAASFRRGVTGEFDGDGPGADFTRKSGLRQVARVARNKTGTRIRFWPDRQVFLRDATFSYDGLAERARQTAYLVPGLTIMVRAEAGAEARTEADGAPREAEFRFAGGISEFCEHLATSAPVTDVIRLTGDGTFTETVPVLDDRGHMTPTEVERTLEVDVAVQWGTGYDTITRSFVNVIATPHHGTHVTGFDRAIVRTLNEQLRNARILKNGDEPVTKEDVLEGLTAIVSVRVPEPQFEGQTKEVLGTPAATKIVQQVVGAQLKQYFENPPRGAKQQARAVLDKVAAAAKTRIAAREQPGHDELDSAELGLALVIHGNAAAVVAHLGGPVAVQDDLDLGAVSGERLVHRVVEDLPEAVLQAPAVGRADVHAWPLADGLQAFEDRQVPRRVGVGRAGGGGGTGGDRFCVRPRGVGERWHGRRISSRKHERHGAAKYKVASRGRW